MENQRFDLWMTQGNFQQPMFDMISEYPKTSAFGAPAGVPSYKQLPTRNDSIFYPHLVSEQATFGSYSLSTSPSEFDSDRDQSSCSPRQMPPPEPVFAAMPNAAPTPTERQHTTSGRRRAQNRAAQRAFRERKEKHARDLETQLAVMQDRYNKLEASHVELNVSHGKLRRTIELLTSEGDIEGELDAGAYAHSRNSSTETLRKVLEILHGDFNPITPIKAESP